MTESDARAVLLMRAFESPPILATDDVAWAGREARRKLGEGASSAAWLAQRARLALERLAQREPGLRPVLAAAAAPTGPAAPALLLAGAALVGGLGESLGGSRHINLLALPLLGLLAWNLVVYALIGGHALWQRLAGRALPTAARRRGLASRLGLSLQGLFDGLHQRAWGGGVGRTVAHSALSAHAAQGAAASPSALAAQAALRRFVADWLPFSAPLQAARGTALLHTSAAVLAAAAVVAMYARGLVFDYQAGWDSTFLQPPQVQRLLAWLLGPAAAISGLPLPDAPALAALRLSAGGGEGAAPWIHRWAITLGAAVVLPRAVLAALAWRQAHGLAQDMPLPDDTALQALLPPDAAEARPVAVLPYSYRLDAERKGAVAPALAAWLGPGLQCQLRPTLPLGAEDHLPDWLPGTLARLPTVVLGAPAPPASLLVLLFALTATPERESHGALVQALMRALASTPAPRPQLRVAVDESGYRQRLAGPDGAQRLAQRRAAWEALLMGLGVVPGFVDLSRAGAAR